MPYEAAKAVAATFCYDIRYALTPLFGPEFVDMCVSRDDERFGHMVINPSIVRRCTEEAEEYRACSTEPFVTNSPTDPLYTSGAAKWSSRSLRSRHVGPSDSESGYCTDSDPSEKYLPSPQSITWTSMNKPRLVERYSSGFTVLGWSKPEFLIHGCGAPPNTPDSSTGEGARNARRTNRDVDEDYGESISAGSSKIGISHINRPSAEVNAAYVLMQLNLADRMKGGMEVADVDTPGEDNSTDAQHLQPTSRTEGVQMIDTKAS
jgi:hypothetical protein